MMASFFNRFGHLFGGGRTGGIIFNVVSSSPSVRISDNSQSTAALPGAA